MNSFNYRVYDNVYDDIITGKKTIEFRLLNEKTESIKPGDEIKFMVLDNEDKFILVEVINKYIFEDVDDLWKHPEVLNNNVLGYSKEEFKDVLNNIFGKDKIKNSKIVGIEFKFK